jgi:hypothetical protein
MNRPSYWLFKVREKIVACLAAQGTYRKISCTGIE